MLLHSLPQLSDQCPEIVTIRYVLIILSGAFNEFWTSFVWLYFEFSDKPLLLLKVLLPISAWYTM